MMNYTIRVLAALCALAAPLPAAAALYPVDPGTISLSFAYTQDFNSLASSGTSSTLPTGWQVFEGGANGDATYAAGNGSSNAGNVYSFGAANGSDRALGSLLSGNLTPIYYGALFTNVSGAPIVSLAIGYTGEEWRYGGSTSRDQLTFQYSLDATAVNNGTWTSVGALAFITPNQPATVGALDGNAAANRSALSGSITGLSIATGSRFAIRFADFDVSGSDDGLAVDDFRIAALPATADVPEPATWATMFGGFGMIGGALRRRSARGSAPANA